jgi:hypothetical protein
MQSLPAHEAGTVIHDYFTRSFYVGAASVRSITQLQRTILRGGCVKRSFGLLTIRGHAARTFSQLMT